MQIVWQLRDHTYHRRSMGLIYGRFSGSVMYLQASRRFAPKTPWWIHGGCHIFTCLYMTSGWLLHVFFWNGKSVGKYNTSPNKTRWRFQQMFFFTLKHEEDTLPIWLNFSSKYVFKENPTEEKHVSTVLCLFGVIFYFLTWYISVKSAAGEYFYMILSNHLDQI